MVHHNVLGTNRSLQITVSSMTELTRKSSIQGKTCMSENLFNVKCNAEL